ncbi:MAG: hypothetical protein ACI4VK_04650 [Candidatus Coproplasma sp.]
MNVKLKRVLRFYFSAGSLNDMLDGMITKYAASSWREIAGGVHSFDKVCTVIEVKEELEELWARLDKVMVKLPCDDLLALKKYASLRTGVSKLSEAERRKIHSALVKFRRKTVNLLSSGKRGYECICAYYALISPDPD